MQLGHAASNTVRSSFLSSSIAEPPAPPGINQLLALLSEAELGALQPKLQYTRLPAGKRLYEPSEAITHLYFPTAGIVSIVHVSASGPSVGLASVGAEGMVGVEMLLGAASAANRAVVQAPGHAYRLCAAAAKTHFAERRQFQRLALNYVNLVMLELSQAAVCKLHHSVEQRLCRWLLACLDRLHGNEIHMTHETIADLLGVRRQGITQAAKRLEQAGIIRYFRGRITVLERSALERCACECHRLMKAQALGSMT
jgi:CRP-like cAMP-binding protein